MPVHDHPLGKTLYAAAFAAGLSGNARADSSCLIPVTVLSYERKVDLVPAGNKEEARRKGFSPLLDHILEKKVEHPFLHVTVHDKKTAWSVDLSLIPYEFTRGTISYNAKGIPLHLKTPTREQNFSQRLDCESDHYFGPTAGDRDLFFKAKELLRNAKLAREYNIK